MSDYMYVLALMAKRSISAPSLEQEMLPWRWVFLYIIPVITSSSHTFKRYRYLVPVYECISSFWLGCLLYGALYWIHILEYGLIEIIFCGVNMCMYVSPFDFFHSHSSRGQEYLLYDSFNLVNVSCVVVNTVAPRLWSLCTNAPWAAS